MSVVEVQSKLKQAATLNEAGDAEGAFKLLKPLQRKIDEMSQEYKPAHLKYFREMALLHAELDNDEDVLECCKRSVDIATALDDLVAVGESLSSLAHAFSGQQKHKQAIEHMQYAIQVSDALGDNGGKSIRTGMLGSLYLSSDRAQDALRCYEEASMTARKAKLLKLERQHRVNMAIACKGMGDNRKALTCYERAVEISKEMGDQSGLFPGKFMVHYPLPYNDHVPTTKTFAPVH